MEYTGSFPTIEKLCEIMAKLLEKQQEGLTVKVTPIKEVKENEKVA